MDWRGVAIKGLRGFIIGGFGGLIGGLVLALLIPPQDASLAWTGFAGFLSAATGGFAEEALRDILTQMKVIGP